MLLIFRLLILLFVGVMAVAGTARAETLPTESNDSHMDKAPMLFYLAKGEPDACGPGCSEWIAAEGEFDQYAGARLAAMAARRRIEHLPIYFDSPGGLLRSAIYAGRVLRARGMTAGVSRTKPDACAGADAQTCIALKQSGETLPAKLDSGASCNGVCIYALIGAKVRRVPPGATLGVRSGRVFRRITDGNWIPIAQSPQQEAGRQAARRTYLQQMDADLRLVEIESNVRFEDVRVLAREEIIELGLASR